MNDRGEDPNANDEDNVNFLPADHVMLINTLKKYQKDWYLLIISSQI